MKYIYLIFCFFFVGCAGCNIEPIDPVDPIPPNSFDAGCKEACDHMQSLDCGGWEDEADGGETCVEFCSYMYEPTYLDLDCVFNSESCVIDQCDINYQEVQYD